MMKILPYLLTHQSTSTYIGGNNTDDANAMTLDSSGNVYITGQARSTDFPTTPGAYQRSLNGTLNAFVSKFNSNLTTLLASTYIGGGFDVSNAISIDSSGNVYIAGFTDSSNYPTTIGAYQTSFGGANDVFVSKFNSNLTTLLASTYIGGAQSDGANAIALY